MLLLLFIVMVWSIMWSWYCCCCCGCCNYCCFCYRYSNRNCIFKCKFCVYQMLCIFFSFVCLLLYVFGWICVYVWYQNHYLIWFYFGFCGRSIDCCFYLSCENVFVFDGPNTIEFFSKQKMVRPNEFQKI